MFTLSSPLLVQTGSSTMLTTMGPAHKLQAFTEIYVLLKDNHSIFQKPQK